MNSGSLFPALIHAAAGGMGGLLVQWAKHLGANVIGTVSTEVKAHAARTSGADYVIVYTEQDFVAEVKRITNGRGGRFDYRRRGQNDI